MEIKNLDERYKNLDNIHLYCFDIMQYRNEAKRLYYTIFANHEGKSYISEIEVKPYIVCTWVESLKESKWALNSAFKPIVILGLEDILMNLGTDKKLLF